MQDHLRNTVDTRGFTKLVLFAFPLFLLTLVSVTIYGADHDFERNAMLVASGLLGVMTLPGILALALAAVSFVKNVKA